MTLHKASMPPVTPEFIAQMRIAFPGPRMNLKKAAEISKESLIIAEAQKQVVDWAERFMRNPRGITNAVHPEVEPTVERKEPETMANTVPEFFPKVPLWKRVLNKLAFWRK